MNKILDRIDNIRIITGILVVIGIFINTALSADWIYPISLVWLILSLAYSAFKIFREIAITRNAKKAKRKTNKILRTLNYFWNFYIKGDYHCDKCKYCWNERTSYEYDEWECGCLIKGDIQDTCRLLPPFKNIIGEIKMKQYDYYRNHDYDNYGEFIEKQEQEQEKLGDLLLEHILKKPGIGIYDYKQMSYRPIEENDKYFYLSELWRVHSNYENFDQPHIRKKLRKEWAELILKTANKLVQPIKPFIFK